MLCGYWHDPCLKRSADSGADVLNITATSADTVGTLVAMIIGYAGRQKCSLILHGCSMKLFFGPNRQIVIPTQKSKVQLEAASMQHEVVFRASLLGTCSSVNDQIPEKMQLQVVLRLRLTDSCWCVLIQQFPYVRWVVRGS